MSNKAPTGAIYKELKRKKKPKKEMAAAKKEYQKKRNKALKDMAWWIPK